MSSSSCARCHRLLDEKFIEWEQHQYHSECFRCFRCEKSLKNQLVYSSRKNPEEFFCSTCSKNETSTFSTRCSRCRKKFLPKSNYVEFDQNLFHVECFVCSSCQKSLIDDEFYRQNEKKMKYFCKICHEKTLNRCELCGETIHDGHIVIFQDKTYHDSCAKCATCKGEIGGQMCFVKTRQGHFYCRSCEEKQI